jgi:hypothetical protein
MHTAGSLVAGGAGLLVGLGWGELVTLLRLGACAYTLINGLGWALAHAHRRPYSVPMFIGAVDAVASGVALVAHIIQRSGRRPRGPARAGRWRALDGLATAL